MSKEELAKYRDISCFDYDVIHSKFSRFMLNDDYEIRTISELLNDSCDMFVRPVSCLNHFSGRILRGKKSLIDFDYGFYHDDLELKCVVSVVKKVEKEWRTVSIVTGKQIGRAHV